MKLIPKFLNHHPHTKVYSEKETSFIAPHNYEVRDTDNNVVSKVHFQEGAINVVGINGVMNENLIVMIMDRLMHFQNSEYACEENAIALLHLNDALKSLERRTNKRTKRGVEGTHEV